MKKSILIFLSVLSLVFALSSCGQVKSGENTQNLNSKGTNSSNNASITAQAAEQKALEHAGIDAADATFKRTELDLDDGIYKYEIEFYVGNIEYDYEIDANTGNIISFDKDID